MSGRHRPGLHLSDLVKRVGLDQELLTQLVAVALMHARIAATEVHDVVLPLLPASKRAFPASLARRLEKLEILDEGFLRDLDAFLAMLERHVGAGTHVGWQADEIHVRGGYETVAHDPGIAALAGALREFDLLHDTVLAALSGARALRDAGMLLDR